MDGQVQGLRLVVAPSEEEKEEEEEYEGCMGKQSDEESSSSGNRRAALNVHDGFIIELSMHNIRRLVWQSHCQIIYQSFGVCKA